MEENRKYYWLKLKEDFFRNKKIKKLRSIAGGDTYTLIYLKMQLLSLKNNGNLYFDGVEDNMIEEIALEIDEEIRNVEIVIGYLIKNQMIEEVDKETLSLTETKECIGKESAVASRVRKHRQLKSNIKMLQCNTNETKCNTEIDIEKELDIEKEKEIEKRNKKEEEEEDNNKEDLFQILEKEWGRTLTPIEYEEISKWEDNEITRYAIKESAINRARSIRYINTIIDNLKIKNITTREEAELESKKWRRKYGGSLTPESEKEIPKEIFDYNWLEDTE